MDDDQRRNQILLRSAKPWAVECSEADAKDLERRGLAKIVSRNPDPFVEITPIGRGYLRDKGMGS
jgi:hypothetical protein